MHRGPASLRVSWRQQQMVETAAATALAQPTLAARPLLLQARLAPLFATYSQLLASGAAAGAPPDGSLPADGSSLGAAAGSSSTAGGGGGFGASSGAGRAVLAYLRRLEGSDGWISVNRALLHGLLFGAWAPAAGAFRPAAAPADEFAPDSEWRLSTGTFSFSLVFARPRVLCLICTPLGLQFPSCGYENNVETIVETSFVETNVFRLQTRTLALWSAWDGRTWH